MKKYFLIFSIITFILSCEKYNETDFDFTVSINKTDFQIGEDIVITVNGGLDKALIYPVLAKYNSNNEIIDFINLISLSDGECCVYNEIGGFSTSYIDDGLICNCEITDDIQHAQELKWNGTEYVPREFYWSDDKFKILIVDPFVDEAGRNEIATLQNPIDENIISESEFFTITYTSTTCSSPQNLVATPSLNVASLSWNAVSEADRYHLRYKLTEDTDWSTITSWLTENEIELTDLNGDSEYQWQVKSICNYSGSEMSEWSSIHEFSTLSETPCYNLNCESLNQLSNYEAYTLNGSSVTASWVIEDGVIGNCFYAEGNCTGGYIEFNITLQEAAKMRLWSRKGFGGMDWFTFSVLVDGANSDFSISENSSSLTNWFVQHESEEFISSGNHTIKIDFGQLGTADNYYIDEIEFYCE